MKLRVLFVEDSEVDADIITRQLKTAGYEVSSRRVEEEDEFKAAIASDSWDVILADYHLPVFSAIEALEIYRSQALDIPFIIISGIVDEEAAVSAMRSGAHDFVSKFRLARLVPAIERELQETQLRRKQRRSEKERALLSQASELLALPLDYGATLNTLPRVVVSQLSDWCIIDIADEGGALVRAQVMHADPDKQELLEKLLPSSAGGVTGIARTVFETKRPILISNVTSAMTLEIAGDQEGNAVVQEIGCTTLLAVPLIAGGKVLGAMTLCYSGPSRHYSDEDVDLVMELSRRGAMVLENARLYARAQEANRLKDQFLAMVSHELRTPLTPIMGAVHMIRSLPRDERVLQKATEMIERNARIQTQIVDDLLDVSRIVSGKFSIRMEPVDLQQVINAAVEAVATADIPIGVETIPVMIRGDADRIHQIVVNLLSNSLKFTPAGGSITISVRHMKSNWIELTVKDTGKGIPASFLPYVFERFRQADPSLTRSVGGLGLGLAITRELVELHGGHIRAFSDGEDKGATFTIELPVETPHSREA